MLMPFKQAKVSSQITTLYQKTGLRSPSMGQPIAPVGELISHYNLNLVEIAELTEQKAYLHLAQKGGIINSPALSGKTRLSGFLYTTRRFGVIFTGNDKTEPVTRRRFSAAHELGHYFRHFLPYLATLEDGADLEAVRFIDNYVEEDETEEIVELSPVETAQVIITGIKLPPLVQMEQEADEFAAELLMPESLVRELTANYRIGYSKEEIVWRLANEMLVSRTAMQRRLRELGIVTSY